MISPYIWTYFPLILILKAKHGKPYPLIAFHWSYYIISDFIMPNMEKEDQFIPNRKLKLLDQVREVLRYHHHAFSTEKSYIHWILRYIYFYNKERHPKDMGEREIESFLSHLATVDKVSASTQKQALNALVFLYRDVLLKPLDNTIAPKRSKRQIRPPTVLTCEEVERLFSQMTGIHSLMARLIYGSGMRLMECIRLRVQDLDFGQNNVFVRGGKGGKDRTSYLPLSIQQELRFHLEKVKSTHQEDLTLVKGSSLYLTFMEYFFYIF